MKLEKKNYFLITVFVIAIFTVSINLVPIFFPALLPIISSEREYTIDPLEPGSLVIPFLIVNVPLLWLGMLYKTNSIPNRLSKTIQFCCNFEVSRNVAIGIIIILLGIYILLTTPQLNIYEASEWQDFHKVKIVIDDFPRGELGHPTLKILYVKNFFLYYSQAIFDNVRIIPFIATISLLILTYFFTYEISKKRFAGIVAMAVILQSHMFLTYDTSATYSNFWTLFYVLSLYLIYKKWSLSPIAYIASIFSKPLTAAFFPLSIIFSLKADVPRKTKIGMLFSYFILAGIVSGVILTGGDFGGGVNTSEGLEFSISDFINGFTAFSFQLRLDVFVITLLLPLIIGLYIISRKVNIQAELVLMLITGTLLTSPILAALTDFNLFPYRQMPFIVFFAVGLGTLFSAKVNHSRGLKKV